MLFVTVGGQLLKLLGPYQAMYQEGPIAIGTSDLTSSTVSPESSVSTPTLPSSKRKEFPAEGNVD